MGRRAGRRVGPTRQSTFHVDDNDDDSDNDDDEDEYTGDNDDDDEGNDDDEVTRMSMWRPSRWGDESNRQWRSKVHNNNDGDDPGDDGDEGNTDNSDDADDDLKTATTKIT